jgi:hypothetical protein
LKNQKIITEKWSQKKVLLNGEKYKKNEQQTSVPKKRRIFGKDTSQILQESKELEIKSKLCSTSSLL